MWHWILIHTGVIPRTPGLWYNFWSGFGSDLAEFAILGAVYKSINCHADKCKRIGFHHVNGTVFKVCRKHHPTGGNKFSDIMEAHRNGQ